ncbi:MAG: peptide-methionine (S)-S-oxide reductase MsrA [Pseudomonadales bacterium]|nr:peptide-methionine (S)-S-oxide reductase MsrA [Pseudomonadales bacterium]MDG1444441.1 peptide-methionine (S)-S-oxide reductase MsrA [Pseudomonadales bacterium]
MGLFQKSMDLPTADTALPGRAEQMPVPQEHFVNGHPLLAPFPDNMQLAVFGMGCFWGAERRFWERDGVYSTAAGYTAGITPNPSYEEVCSGHTGHNEVVLVVYNPAEVSYEALLALFWESHNPTEGMRQGNDMGTQYRSGIYTYDEDQLEQAKASEIVFQEKLKTSGFGSITTEIKPIEDFYYAEHYHQQYLAKVPNGYCGLGGTGVCYA